MELVEFTPVTVSVGAMAGYHSALAFHPGSSYGVIVLLTSGRFFDATKIMYDVFERVQPAMDRALAQRSEALYAGTWIAESGSVSGEGEGEGEGMRSEARIEVRSGTLWADKMVLNGSDILSLFGAGAQGGKMPLRLTGRSDEFRYALLSPKSFFSDAYVCV